MSQGEYIITTEMLKDLDALYEASEDMGILGRRATHWDVLVQDLRAIRRRVEAGVIVKIEGTPIVLNSWETFYDWAHGRYYALEDSFTPWIGDDS